MESTETKKAWGGFKETLNRIRILTTMQIKNNNKKKSLTSGRKLVSLIITLLLFVILTIVFYLFIKVMTQFLALNFLINYRFLIFFLMILQVGSIVSCTTGLMQSLFLDKDNTLLLSFPCRHSEVFISKLLVFYVSEFKKNFLIAGTFMFAFGLFQANTIMSELPFNKVLYYVTMFFILFILPIIPVLIGSLLSLPLALLKRLIKGNPLIQFIVQIALIVSLLIGVILIVNYTLPSEIKVIKQYALFIDKFESAVTGISKYGLYCRTIVLLMFNSKPLVNVLIILGILVFGSIGVTFIIMPFFFNIASHSLEEARMSSHKVKVDKKNHPIFISFLKKDSIIEFRNLGSLVSNNLLILLMPSIIILFCGIYSRMSLNLTSAPFFINIFMTLIILLLCLGNNEQSACAITKEGSEFVLVKTAPNETSIIGWSKLTILLIINVSLTVLSFIILFIGLKITNSSYLLSNTGDLKISQLLILCLITILSNVGLIFHGLEMDIRNPHLIEYASTESLKENMNIKSINISSVVYGLILTVVFLLMNISNFTCNLLIPLVIALAYAIFRGFLFKKYLYAFFDDIEL